MGPIAGNGLSGKNLRFHQLIVDWSNKLGKIFNMKVWNSKDLHWTLESCD